MKIRWHQKGQDRYCKEDYPIRYGRFHQVETADYRLQLNLKGEIKYITGLGPAWPDPLAWLKRTAANDWVYYSAGDYQGIFGLYNEHYVPIPAYASNHLIGEKPFRHKGVRQATNVADQLKKRLRDYQPQIVSIADRKTLADRARHWRRILTGPVSVLPPDTRHVDYDVIPIDVSRGCLYRCDFCCLRSGAGFRIRTRAEIKDQIEQMSQYLGPECTNYCALFLGQHDTLAAGQDPIEFAACQSYQKLGLHRAYMQDPQLFAFASVHSLLAAKTRLFEMLEQLPFKTWINVGLESADQKTLDKLGKPISRDLVEQAFERLIWVNRNFFNVEVTANVVFDLRLPEQHADSVVELSQQKLARRYNKGAIYLSPLYQWVQTNKVTRREWLGWVHRIQRRARLPVYLYLIQRL